ncbi:hypothetical protein J5N97_006455 [Dioscorea zingiberensis]|uniref:Uncharacterized protein n=1 Tax=Dioscorea zingiberensis TaxID=325984 RepID=A0A9D5HTC4_9LILI|nr:hypothetical protein J5N97_006455 [Dioscorea zingiberensis]
MSVNPAPPSSHGNLDEQILQLMQCKPLSEQECESNACFVEHGKGILQSQGRLWRKMRFMPASLSSKSHHLLTALVDSRHKMVDKVKNCITNIDPEKKKEKEKVSNEARCASLYWFVMMRTLVICINCLTKGLCYWFPQEKEEKKKRGTGQLQEKERLKLIEVRKQLIFSPFRKWNKHSKISSNQSSLNSKNLFSLQRKLEKEMAIHDGNITENPEPDYVGEDGEEEGADLIASVFDL